MESKRVEDFLEQLSERVDRLERKIESLRLMPEKLQALVEEAFKRRRV